MLAYTFSLLVGESPLSAEELAAGGKSEPASDTASAGPGHEHTPGSRVVWNQALRQVRARLCPWARLQLYWNRWPSTAPAPELAALLAHVARSLPLETRLDQPALALVCGIRTSCPAWFGCATATP